MVNASLYSHEISIVIAGAAGQGVQTVELLLTRLLKICGYNFFATKEYMSRVRGGANSTEIRVSSSKVSAYVERIDLLIPLSREALEHVSSRMSSGTAVIGERDKLHDDSAQDYNIIDIPFSALAKEIGGPIFSNIIAVGLICGLFGLKFDVIEAFLRSYFARKGDDIVAKNIDALKKGYETGRVLVDDGILRIEIDTDDSVSDDTVLNGAEAVGIGAIAGGCNFISSYPMSPSTAVLVFLAQQSKDFDIVVEQAEDEIAAINMSLGAWYAGARAMVTTSGGGFALMTEGVSLAGMIESPAVIHIAQRPGPATSLPTRTEQGDLELALYAGHGEFPRIILAPGSVDDGVVLTHRAFNQADKFQVPVFILTDQYYIDSYYNSSVTDISTLKNDDCLIETGKDYKRFALTETGISPRGVPGFGEGLVVVDSDEHDEDGHLTEDLGIRVDMVDKRLGKLDALLDDTLPPTVIGSEGADNVVVCWGSTFNGVNEAFSTLGRDDIKILHFRQVFPLPPDIDRYFEGAKKVAIIEGNATSQFGKVLKLYGNIDIQTKILKYNGMQFSVEELKDNINDAFGPDA
ncbi:2-oxoacid:acceptor oxidoreductase subunit alpha [Candidatus Latescibacterota bacterium]